jgi:hypothetical protein
MSKPGPFYDGIFRRLEANRWLLAEVPFVEVDVASVPAGVVDFVRSNCLVELSSLYAVRMFLRDFGDNVDFCQFMSVWYFEEMKHYLVLREYLKLFGREPAEEELRPLDTELLPAPWPGTLAMHYCGELRLGMWYHRWSEVMPEPVLCSIYRTIGDDEFRHAQCYRDFMLRAAERTPEVVLDFAQAAKWMMVGGLEKHPTTLAASGPGEPSVVDRVPEGGLLLERVRDTITAGDEARLRARILATLSTLCATELGSLQDLVGWTRAHGADAASPSAEQARQLARVAS